MLCLSRPRTHHEPNLQNPALTSIGIDTYVSPTDTAFSIPSPIQVDRRLEDDDDDDDDVDNDCHTFEQPSSNKHHPTKRTAY
ncbi:hypothetical protein JDV02_007285 [Purpureocillium takamizusanense]|uniref:Uncharacterized protein n=1 Tax=Purpureocillium takamizusanense TaxID=2060973 RepID=A0A9Q8QK02_9HYPO|nr:uncharacterized protein JDV02_007285 [Purpureocillium takamizusanense]UNI21283.1 hypothetical protein JDV02_007285 [Purpureocillium takamizusanense]